MRVLRQLHDEGFVEIRLHCLTPRLRGARVSFLAAADADFRPCAIYRGRDADSLLEGSFWNWNEAAQFGRVKFLRTPRAVYWNRYWDGMHRHRGAVTVRIELLEDAGCRSVEQTLELVPAASVYLDDWAAHIPPDRGWSVHAGCLSIEPGRDVGALGIRPGLHGRYHVVLGVPSGTLLAGLGVTGDPQTPPLSADRYRPEFEEKTRKEIPWRTVDLRPDSVLTLTPLPLTIRHPELYPFGSVAYLKLVPVRPRRASPPRTPWPNRKLALYFEPYSWAFFYGLRSPEQVRQTLSLFRDMGADEIHNQVLRFGSKALHYSRVVERHDTGHLTGDDGTVNAGPTDMVRHLDILREAIDACRELGVTHYANAGLSNCYPGTDFEDRISRDHPEWRQANVLRFNRPETRRFVADVIAEFLEWGTHGISIDCMRYPYHHTEEDLLLLFQLARETIDRVTDTRSVPLAARIPAGDVIYFRAFAQLARTGVVQCVIPSNLFMRDPVFSLKPYLRWKDYGCRVYGLIDGWKQYAWALHHCQCQINLNPGDIRADMKRFLREGADGVFVYQADVHLADAFNRPVFRQTLRGRVPAGIGVPG